MVLNSVENRFNFELDGGSPFGGLVCLFQPQTSPTDGDPLPPRISSHLSRASCGARPVRFSFASPTISLLPREITHKFCYRAKIKLFVVNFEQTRYISSAINSLERGQSTFVIPVRQHGSFRA
jgi:hypothetical protein